MVAENTAPATEPRPFGGAEELAQADRRSQTSTETPAGPHATLRALPAKVVLIYDVLAGDGGFNLGQATYTWQVDGERYRLESVAEATGMAALFMSGRITQTSEGRVDGHGLLPQQFTQTKKRTDRAVFDWQQRQLVMDRGTEPLSAGAQDLLSFAFHLAMTVGGQSDEWHMAVTNGRKIRNYLFRVLGRETVRVGRENLDAVHVQGSRAGEGTLDVWLAPGRHWLPVRIRTLDQKGSLVELTLEKQVF